MGRKRKVNSKMANCPERAGWEKFKKCSLAATLPGAQEGETSFFFGGGGLSLTELWTPA
jgi:hypothetical protein